MCRKPRLLLRRCRNRVKAVVAATSTMRSTISVMRSSLYIYHELAPHRYTRTTPFHCYGFFHSSYAIAGGIFSNLLARRSSG